MLDLILPDAAVSAPRRPALCQLTPLGPQLCKSRDVPCWIFHPDLACTVESLSLRHHYARAFRRRDHVIDWAGISRPQVYYSIDKLAQLGLVRASEAESAAGPERRVFHTTAEGRVALADALEREEWTTHRERPPFLTWIALSWQARPGVFRQQIERRREFLKNELSREEATLLSIKKEVGHRFHEAVWMVTLMIERIHGELHWLRKLERELPRRAAAKRTESPLGGGGMAR